MREGGLRVYTTIEPRLQRAAKRAITETLELQRRPGGGDRLGRARHGRDPRDGGRDPGQHEEPVQPRGAVGAAGRLDVQGVRARRRRSSRAPTPTRPTTPRRRSPARAGRGARATTRPASRGRSRPTATTYAGSISVTTATLRSDNTVYAQLTLDVGPDYVWRMAKRLGINLTQKPVASIGLGPLSRLAARDGGRLRDVRRRAASTRSRRRSRRSCCRTARSTRPPAGASRSRSARSRDGVAWKVNEVLGENALYGTGSGSRRRRPPERGQDGHDRGSRRRLVRRLHARPLDRRLDGLSERRDPDAERARPGRRRRDVPGADLAPATWRPPSGSKPVREFLEPEPRGRLPAAREALLRLHGVHPDRTRRPRRRPTTTTTPTTPTADRRRRRRADAEAGADRRATPPPRRSAADRRRSRPSSAAPTKVRRGVDGDRPADDRRGARARARARAAARGRGGRRSRTAAGRVLAEDARSVVDLPPFPALGDGRLRAPRGRRAGDAADRRPHRRRPAGAARRSSAGEAMAIATGGVVPGGRGQPSSRSRTSRRATTPSRCPAPLATATTSATAAAISARATRSSSPARGSGRRTSARSRPRASRRVRCHRVPRVVVVVTGTRARARRASRSARARSTTRTASSSRRRCAARARRSSGCRRSRTTPTRRAPRSSAASRPTCSSRPAGSRSASTTSCARPRPSSGVEEVFWRVAVRPGKPIAFGVRGRDARLRAAGQPRLVARRLRAVRPPGAARAAGRARDRAGVPARAARPRRRGGLGARDSLLRARSRVEDGEVVLDPLTGQESHMIAQAATADALVLVPRGNGELEAGSPVSYLAL